MSAAEFRKALEQSQLSKVQFAFAIGVDGRTGALPLGTTWRAGC
jgi:hypothetical protein